VSRLLWCAVAALILLCGSGLAHAEDVKVGVVVTTFVNLTDQEADDVGAILARVVNDQLQASASGGADVRSRIGQIPEDCSEKQACLQSLGKKLGVRQLLLLVVVRVGERRQVSCTWADVSTGKAETRAPVTLQSGDNIHQVFGAVVTELLPGVKARAGGKAEPVGTTGTTKADVPAGDPDDPFIAEMDQPESQPRGRRLTGPVLIAGGVSAGLLAIGATGSVIAWRRSVHYRDGGCETAFVGDCQEREDKSQSINLFADIFWAGGVIAGGVTTYFYLTSADDRSEAPAVTVGPTRDGGIGVSYGGRF